jgi:mycothiol system anti-sigma-R factor
MPVSNSSIRCEEVVEQLLTFLDREIEETRRNVIEQHLQECRSCCSRADFELALRSRVREVAAKRPSSALREKIGKLIDRF